MCSQLRPKFRGPYISWGEEETVVIQYSAKEKKLLDEPVRKLFLQSKGEFETIQAQLDTLNKIPKYTKPDGDCLFESILTNIVHPKKYNARSLRKQTALYMALHPDVFFEYIEPLCISKTAEAREQGVLAQDQYYSFESYVTSLFRGDIWGDQISGGAVGRMWQITISIIFPTGDRPLKLFHRKERPSIVIISNGGNEKSSMPSSHFSGSGIITFLLYFILGVNIIA